MLIKLTSLAYNERPVYIVVEKIVCFYPIYDETATRIVLNSGGYYEVKEKADKIADKIQRKAKGGAE